MKNAAAAEAETPKTRAPIRDSASIDLKPLLTALTAFKRGDFTARLPEEWAGIAGKIAETFNEVIATNERMAKELERVGRVVGKEGRIKQRATLGDVSGRWADSIGSVNELIGDLVQPTSEMARVIGAVAKGDLSQTMATNAAGFQHHLIKPVDLNRLETLLQSAELPVAAS